jgi:hypothetical protein
MRQDYAYKLDQCDVPQDRRSELQRFRAKRAEWLSWLETDEHHAIWSTLHSMVWADVAFKTLTGLAIDNEENALNNSLVMEAMLNGHVATQVLGIRRLMDRGRGNISLRRLIIEVGSCFELFTRENYVCFDGDPYDYQTVRDARISSTDSRASIRRNERAKIACRVVSSRPLRNGSSTVTQTIWRSGVTAILRTGATAYRDRRLLI